MVEKENSNSLALKEDEMSVKHEKTEEFNIGGAVDYSWLVKQKDSFWEDEEDSLLDTMPGPHAQ